MSSRNSMKVAVDVAVDPQTAFHAFTEEMGEWWRPGPINFYDSAKTTRKKCEPGVGGRILEVHDETTGDGFEVGRITEWEPGARLAWSSATDDTKIEVRFDATEGGTRVTVEGWVPPGGSGAAGFAYLRVTPSWFTAWCERRDGASRERPTLSRLALIIHYDRPAAAAKWIHDVIGLESDLPLPTSDDEEQTWCEFELGDAIVVVWKRTASEPAVSAHTPLVFVDDLDAHYERAKAAGGEVAREIHQHGYRAYSLRDPEGHEWSIAQALASVRHPSRF